METQVSEDQPFPEQQPSSTALPSGPVPQAAVESPENSSKSRVAYVVVALILLIATVGGYVVYDRIISPNLEVEDVIVEEGKDEPDADVSSTPSGTKVTEESYSEICTKEGGEWLEEYDECEDIEEKVCVSNGGSFDDCESECRHDESYLEGETNCIAVCVKVCSF